MSHNHRMSNDDNNGKKGFLPFDPSAFGKIKLGHGVTGKIAYNTAFVIIGLIILSTTLALSGQINLSVGLAVLMVIVWALSSWKIFDFAEKNPAAALLEGSEFVRLREIEQAAKDRGTVIDVAAEATTNPTLIEDSKGEKNRG